MRRKRRITRRTAPARSQNGASEVLVRRTSSIRVVVREAFSYKVTSVGVTIFMPGTVVDFYLAPRIIDANRGPTGTADGIP
jgi:hypothetical protein